MAWATSDRRGRLPRRWLQLREEVFRTKGRSCYVVTDGLPCNRTATEVDHKIPSGSDELENLFPICTYHHRRKSSSEGWEALRRKRRQTRKRVDKQFGWAEKRPEPETPFKHPWMR